MTVGVYSVKEWVTDTFVDAGAALRSLQEELANSAADVSRNVDGLLGVWRGSTAEAASTQLFTHRDGLDRLSVEVGNLAARLGRGGEELSNARTHVLSLVGDAESAGFAVADDGTVSAAGRIAALETSGDAVGHAAAEEVRNQCRALTLEIVHALRRADDAVDQVEKDLAAAADAFEGGDTPAALLGSLPSPTSSESIGPAGGYWDIDYSTPLPNDQMPYGPYDTSTIAIDPETEGNTGPWTAPLSIVEDPANPDAIVATAQTQYRIRVVGSTPTDHQVIMVDGTYYPATYYEYEYEIQESSRITNHIEPGLDAIYPGAWSDWQPLTYDDIMALQNQYPEDVIYVPR